MFDWGTRSAPPGSVPLGVAGVTVSPGDHVCAFYRGSGQRDEILGPFLREALLAGDKCICALDDPAPLAVTGPLVDNAELDAALQTGRLELLPAAAAYVGNGRFCVEDMLAFWERGIGTAVRTDGFGFVRAVGEMTWALREVPGVEHLLTYEALLNDFLPRYPQVILCLYDLERFTDGTMLLDLLRTHPFVLLGGQLLENPWYMRPAEFLASRP
jgi:DcmR-like sensory protein